MKSRCSSLVQTLLFVAVLGCVKTAADETKTKTVSTLLNAKWNATPIVFEISEFLNEEDPSLFWSFIDRIASQTTEFQLSQNTDKSHYEWLLEQVRPLLSEVQISLLRFALSMHLYSPKIEMFHQIAYEKSLPDCETVLEFNGKFTCNPDELESLSTSEVTKAPELYKVDHQYPVKATNDGKPHAVLYGLVGTDSFKAFHRKLKSLADNRKLYYVLRHFAKKRDSTRVRLSGYGVELQIKSTEYKAQDDTKVKAEKGRGTGEEATTEDNDEDVEGFIFSKLKSLNPDLSENLDKLRQQLLEENHELAPLKVWQLQELSLQAAERVLGSSKEEALKVLTQLSQNFPLLARSLVKTPVRQALKDEIRKNQQVFANEFNLQPTDAALFINGLYHEIDVVDIFTLVEEIRGELKLVEGLHKIGVPPKHVSSLLSLDMSPPSQNYAVDIRDSAVLYVNDIEKDAQYKRWSASYNELLRPMYPGMLRNLRRNMYNLILIVDPVQPESQPLIKLAESFLLHNAPLRIGFVFAVNSDPSLTGQTDAGVALLNAFNYVSQQHNSVKALSFITDLYAASGDSALTVAKISKILKTKFSADVDDVLGEDSDYDVGRQLTREFLKKTGFLKYPQVLLNGVPLDEKQLNGDEFEEAVLSEIMKQTPTLQKAAFRGDLKDDDPIVDYLMSQPNVMPRLNSRILGSEASYLDFTATSSQTEKLVDQMEPREITASVADDNKYLTSRPNSFEVITLWVIGDVLATEGRTLFSDAVKTMQNSRNLRISLIHNSKSSPSDEEFKYLNIIDSLLKENNAATLLKVLGEKNAAALLDGKKSAKEFSVSLLPEDELKTRLKLHSLFVKQVLGFEAGQRGVVSNGKVIGPFAADEDFTEDDFALLERHSMASWGEKIVQDAPSLQNSDLAMRVSSVLLAKPSSKVRHEIGEKLAELSVLNFAPKHPDLPFVEIVAVMDPLSNGAQKLAPLLMVLQEVLNARIRVFLNCVEKHSEMPLKNFYRLVLEPDLMFNAEGRQLGGPVARFGVLPTAALLTQNLLVPDNWLVEPVWSPYDLDNIRLEDVETDVQSVFELENLLLEGHCFDQLTGSPPRGLQITLGTAKNPVQVDTIVMANLGYLQLKANPGSWILRLREGRSAELYDIVSHEGTDTPSNSSDTRVLISSFKSHVLKIRVNKKPGKAQLDLLSDDDESSGIWNSIASTFSSKTSDEEDEKLNIFSLASGHLYERFLRIMMLSVLKNTKTPVKFWFLKNYLSPTVKDFLPKMAEKYGFEYELVQYKWPRWLHQQKEKQRIIWGYKILFLDVLFPLNVKKIIFVDADQVVRADLKELRDLDLGGAPYGYTPFCDSRKEIDGFRFWKSGYWRNHLQGRKYHISALYVVDLKRFRRIAAGDRLRGQYQALSQDPNSLSNLDQDLPNNMIHQVPIKSLPQEWLWCETWCDDASKKKAKTIDLCNNPMTKEAKLEAAVRIISEWTDYDNEIKQLQANLSEENKTSSELRDSHDRSEL